METKTVIRRYETRRNARREEPTSKSQIDWKRTRRQNILLDSDEDDDDDESACTSEELTPSEDESHEKDTTVDNENSFSNHKEKGHDDAVTEDVEEEECIALGKRKRSSTSVMYDSDKSDDSDIPVRKVLAKRRCILDEDECSQEWKHNKAPSAEEEANDKKQKQTMKLKELSRRRSFQTSSSSERYEEHEDEVAAEEEKSYKLPLTPSESSDVADNDSMKDFIVEDEEECAEHEEDENQFQERQLAMSNSQLLERYVPNFTRCDPSVHIQRVIKAFLINAIDDTFLKSLYGKLN
uniref:Coiled-coil domain-containing protein n=1 Tax=Sphenodon punctatus TaxID=8508 RepID=A0A8D0HN35_SPHPU